jgi:uncharacterized membrane protein
MSDFYLKIKTFFNDTPLLSMKTVYIIWILGFVFRFIASLTHQEYIDYAEFRLPIAKALAEGELLYRDYPYNHMPIYPYISGFMYLISPKEPVILSMFIRLPMTIADSLVPFAIYLLMKSMNQAKIGQWASIIYAINPISIYEIGLSHWDGMATLFALLGLTAILKNKMEMAGIFAGIGFLVKQFPLAILLVGVLHTKDLKKSFRMIICSFFVVILILGPFLIICPTDFINGIFSHKVYLGTEGEGIIVGTVASIFQYMGEPWGRILWGILFGAALLIPMVKVKQENILPFTGILFILLSVFVYVTHRQMLLWSLPFVFILLVQNWKRTWVPVILLGIGYWIRLIKPAWYFGIIVLIAGIWLYYLFYQDLNEIYIRESKKS